MLTGLDVPSLACTCVFNRQYTMQSEDPMKLSFKLKTEIYQRIEQKEGEKNVVIYLFIMFTPRICQKWLMYFLHLEDLI